MFESDEKRELRQKYQKHNKLTSIGAATGKKFQLNSARETRGPATVFGELKLSE